MTKITPDREPRVECQIESASGRIYVTARASGVVLKQNAASEFSPRSGASLIHLTLDEARELADDLLDAIAALDRPAT